MATGEDCTFSPILCAAPHSPASTTGHGEDRASLVAIGVAVDRWQTAGQRRPPCENVTLVDSTMSKLLHTTGSLEQALVPSIVESRRLTVSSH